MMYSTVFAAISIKCSEINSCPNKTPTLDVGLTNIAQLIIGLVGSLAMLVMLWGGFRYVISRGDPSAIKSAKDTIMYALIGVVVAILAYAIVTFVAKNL